MTGVLAASQALPAAAPVAGAPDARSPLAVKVLVVNLFGYEAAPWIVALAPRQEIPVPGLAKEYPTVRCNADSVCQMTTGMGHANAAASLMAVLLSDQFDLRQTYILVAGIAGIDPAQGTIGSVAWARYVVDSGLAHEIDARELPRGWQDGYFGVFTDDPSALPKFEYHTELYRLDDALVHAAFDASKSAALADSDDVKAYRAHYVEQAAHQSPRVIQCDTLSADTWWAGRRLGEHARHWIQLLTDGKGVYCTTQQEDNAVLAAVTRGADAGRVDLRRVAVVRAGADFDRPYPGQTAFASLLAQRALEGSGRIAVENLVRAGLPLVTTIVQHWNQWRDGIPAATAP